MRPHMHARGIEIAEPGAPLLGLALDEVDCAGQKFLVNRFHALGIEGACVLNYLLADLSEGFVYRVVVFVSRPTFQYPARTELLAKVGILGIVRILRLLLGVQVVQVAEELLETVDSRQVFITVAEMVFAKLPRRIPKV